MCGSREKITKQIGTQGSTQKLITNQGVKKFTLSEDSKTSLSEEKILTDSHWDGFHGIITNIKPKLTEAQEKNNSKNNLIDMEKRECPIALLKRYGRLWKIEESFRINKHTLSMRPIYHFKPERIKTHIAICYMAFSIVRHMEYKVKLTQKITLQTMLDELMNVQASMYRHIPTGRLYTMPGKFTNQAAKIYKIVQIDRRNHAQEIGSSL